MCAKPVFFHCIKPLSHIGIIFQAPHVIFTLHTCSYIQEHVHLVGQGKVQRMVVMQHLMPTTINPLFMVVWTLFFISATWRASLPFLQCIYTFPQSFKHAPWNRSSIFQNSELKTTKQFCQHFTDLLQNETLHSKPCSLLSKLILSIKTIPAAIIWISKI